MHAGADGGFKVAGAAVEMKLHCAHTLLHNSFHGAAPAGVEDPDRTFFRIDQNDWQTVGSLNRQHHAGSVRDHAVANHRNCGRGDDAMNDVGVNLAHGNEGPGVPATGPECGEERGAIALDGWPRIDLGEAEVEGMASVHAGVSTLASREAVNQPRIFLEAFRLEDFDL